MKFGDKKIVSPPLINTSLQGLADVGWCLSVWVSYIPSYGYTKLKYRFCDPDKNGYPYLVFKMWYQGRIFGSSIVADLDEIHQKSYELIKILVEKDLTPSFTRPTSFNLMPTVKSNTITVEKEKLVFIEPDELEFVTRKNKEKLEALPKKFLTKGRDIPVPQREVA